MNFVKPEYDSQPDDSLEKSMSLVASAISDPSRVSILCALMDGRAWTATELSAVAGIAASTTSGHLARLLSNGLVICLTQGRHRYYSLASHHIAGLLENLMGVAMNAHTSPAPSTPLHLRYARTCYDHLAGEVAVKIYTFMLQEKWLESDGTALTPAGKSHFQNMGAVLNPHSRRKSCCPCLDWSQRRFHLGGDAGSALLTLLLQKGWITRTQGYREVNVTESGRIAINRLFSMNLT
ncbi:ArsR family transcriptional regulator [Buttiauxella brennerae ATCC 51605]|jgi:DNA-binding transcriptional ArsR family regulator|uniref:ArsR family transcriptional regulator n=1 Tax=Buttiauxella brennerae ATCC 51605 TaxID=1354251 RepID=A0A1B7IVJ1_9ENTR|nr:helix-turn-helix transcriptional regulator [Buttiauxella brennerae]OAT33935.1 ArsR family transcriptional regulator [Buttiauxella brennerae ATCC 51605]